MGAYLSSPVREKNPENRLYHGDHGALPTSPSAFSELGIGSASQQSSAPSRTSSFMSAGKAPPSSVSSPFHGSTWPLSCLPKGSLRVAACAMQGWRLHMEDRHAALLDFNGERGVHFFAVLDGHGGSDVADVCIERIPACLRHLAASGIHAPPYTNESGPAAASGNVGKTGGGLDASHLLSAMSGPALKTLFQRCYLLVDASLSRADTPAFMQKYSSCPKVLDCASDDTASAGVSEDNSLDEDSPTPASSPWNSFLSGMLSFTSTFLPSQLQQKAEETLASRFASGDMLSAASGAGATRGGTQGRPGAVTSTFPQAAVQCGCTAVCLLLTPKLVVCANVGDSRAVLCRGTEAVDLSVDHKPALYWERYRILKAGGYVEANRVNGNLNLSRALGDLVYKQNLSLRPEEQIISGCPDVRILSRRPEDSFIIIACDGIWETLSGQAAVDFVASRIDTAATLSEIIEELFEGLLSPSPHMTEGLGADNMTCQIIDLCPEKRRTRPGQDSSPPLMANWSPVQQNRPQPSTASPSSEHSFPQIPESRLRPRQYSCPVSPRPDQKASKQPPVQYHSPSPPLISPTQSPPSPQRNAPPSPASFPLAPDFFHVNPSPLEAAHHPPNAPSMQQQQQHQQPQHFAPNHLLSPSSPPDRTYSPYLAPSGVSPIPAPPVARG